jgi:hypothetical protein
MTTTTLPTSGTPVASNPSTINAVTNLPDATPASYCIPIGQDRWCGPAALAYLLRTDTDTAANLLQEEGRTSVSYCTPEWMFGALATEGYEAKLVMPKRLSKRKTVVTWKGDRPICGVRGALFTLAKWLQFAKPRPDEEFIVGVTRHWLVIHGDRYYDNNCPEGNTLDKCPWLRRSVLDAHRVTRLNSCKAVAA